MNGSKRAGKNAVEYIKTRYGKKLKELGHIECIAGENVNYVKPDLINKRDLAEDIIFTFRVNYPDRRINIQFRDENDNIIYTRKKVYVIPSEMNELVINLDTIGINKETKTLKVEVVPRPEVLIEEEE